MMSEATEEQHRLKSSVGKATPMIEQYIEIKSANPDSLLFYRMGDFYELFFDDAIKAAQALGITLTKRGRHQGEDIPMCGVPVHCADDYLQKLIAQGYRVAVCEQIEDPAEAKKRGAKSVVRRDVIRLVTPGTLTEENLLDPTEANYLMALGHVQGVDDIALAWIDISTGIFRVSLTNQDHLLTDIMRVNPSELLVADTVFSEPSIKPVVDLMGKVVVSQPLAFFDSRQAVNRISEFYKVATLDGFAQFTTAELSAIAAIIAYIEKTQITQRPALMRPERELAGATVVIDPATRQNLELLRTLSGSRDGSLLKAIDRTVTSGGARMLADRLMTPLTLPFKIDERLDSVAYFVADTPLVERLRHLLKGSADMPRALSRLAVGRGGPRDLATIQTGIDIANNVVDLFADLMLPQELADAMQALQALPIELYSHLDRALADDLPLLKRDGGFVRAAYSSELDELRSLRDESRRIIANLQNKYADETGVKALKIKYNNILGYFIEVTALQAAALTANEDAKKRFIHRQTMANAMRFTTTELAEMETCIAHAAEKALDIELAVFDRLAQEVVEAAESIRQAANALAVIDVSSALAFLADEQGYCRPLVDDSRAFSVVGGRHPVVEQALRRAAAQPFVANNCDLSPNDVDDFGKIWLLTGPNMGGKSTFLRQNALIVLLAQMGSFVPAGSAHIGVVDRLFSRVGASDDLARGRSTFMVEMVETAAILNQAGDRSLVILDEIGRGTATYDGLSIAWASVECLHEVNHCRAIFATHFHEMTALSEKLPRLQNVTMKVKEWNGEVIFLHEVTKGVADRSYGVQVAKLAGLPEHVVSRARDVLQQLEKGERSGASFKLVDDLPLFSVRADSDVENCQTTTLLIDSLNRINPDQLSPKEALDELYRLKNLVQSS